MKIAVRYQSRGGNTKAVAQAIAKAAGVTAETIGVPLDGPADLLFVGGGVYAWTIDRSLKDYLQTLNPDTVKSLAAFSTAGTMDGTGKIAAIAKERGIHVCEKTLPVKFGAKNHAWLGGKGTVELTDKQLQLIDGFVREMIK